jgi:hypothetical protein
VSCLAVFMFAISMHARGVHRAHLAADHGERLVDEKGVQWVGSADSRGRWVNDQQEIRVPKKQGDD